MPSTLIAILLTAAIAVSTLAAAQQEQTAQIRFVPKSKTLLDGESGRVTDESHVRVQGLISADSPQKLALTLADARKRSQQFSLGGQPIVRVFLDSPGGQVQSAITMGRLLRASAAEVWVDRGNTCESACILVLSGGVSRNAVPSAKLGVHRPYFEKNQFARLSFAQSQKRYAALSTGVKDYLAEMGIADELYQTMMQVPSGEMQYLDQNTAERTALLGNDPAHEEWERARAFQLQGDQYMQGLDSWIKCTNEGLPQSQCQLKLRPSRDAK